jgi:hypothetical protein
MLVEALTVTSLVNYIKVISGAISIMAFVLGVFRVINWVKNKFTSIDANVIQLKNTIDTQMGGLREDVKHQTNAIVSAMGEQRADFRTFYAPTLLMMQQNAQLQAAVPIRAKQPPKRKPPVKKK